jgi:hypothetical protein
VRRQQLEQAYDPFAEDIVRRFVAEVVEKFQILA